MNESKSLIGTRIFGPIPLELRSKNVCQNRIIGTRGIVERLVMAVKFKKNDQVIVTTGKSKGHVGVIERVYKDGYVIVTGANMKKKHVKASAG